jgi:DNA-binding winged helix-turn-helix (wHTH) protein/tetratricopeptide (TPR) repeat protein
MRFVFGNLEIDLSAYRLKKDGANVRVTPKEWGLLRELLTNKNQVQEHRALLKKVWGDVYDSEVDYVHTYMSRLRKKVEDDPKNPQYILTESGIGYWFNQDEGGDKDTQETPPAEPSPQPTTRLINILPQVVASERFVGRATEQKELHRLILDGTPLILVYGRGGIGKTALVSRILLDILQATPPLLHGIVALSAGTNGTGINLPRIITDLSRLVSLPTEETDTTERAKTQDIIIALLERLRGSRYVLLLDNMETLQDAITGEIQDRDVLLFLEMAIGQGSGLQIIMTGREQITFPASIQIRKRQRDMDKGLSPEESIELLRLCDPDGAAKLRQTDATKLRILAELTGGYPRALEVIAGLLQSQPLLTVDKIIADTQKVQGSVQEVLVQQAFDRLSPDAQRVMQCIAAFNLPIHEEALVALAAPFFDAKTDLSDILARLIKTFFLSIDRDTQTLALHPIDRDYSYAKIPASGGTFNRQTIHRRIAEYYQSLQAPTDGREQLPLYRTEIDQRILAQDYETAAQRLMGLDEKYLSPGAYYGDLKRLYESLLPHITTPSLKRQVLLRLAAACRLTGQLHDAEMYARQVQQAAVQAGDDLSMAQALEMMGWVYYDLGIFGTVRDFWRNAIRLYETDSGQHDPLIANTRGGMGWVSYLLGEYGQAEENFRQALTIYRQLNDERGQALNLGDVGMVKIALGNYAGAIQDLEYAFQIADAYDLVREASYKGSYLAVAYLLNGQLEKALEITRIISQHEDVPINLAIVLTIHGILLTRLNLPAEAQAAFEDALRQADFILKSTLGLYQVRYAHALALAGLSLLRQDAALRQSAIEDYETALSICNTAGVVQRQIMLLDALCQAEGGAWLESVQVVLGSMKMN